MRKPRLWGRRGLVFSIVVAIAIAMGSTTPAVSEPKSTSSPRTVAVPQWVGEQERLLGAVDRIEAQVHSRKLSGLAGLRVRVEQRELILYWHGKLPEELSQLIGQLSVTVRVVPARYPIAVLDAEARRISLLPAKSVGTDVLKVGTLPGFGGLEVTVKRGHRKTVCTSPARCAS